MTLLPVCGLVLVSVVPAVTKAVSLTGTMVGIKFVKNAVGAIGGTLKRHSVVKQPSYMKLGHVMANFRPANIDPKSIPFPELFLYPNFPKSTKSFNKALECSNLKATKFGCLSGGDGTWLELTGGLFHEKLSDGRILWKAKDFLLEEITRLAIWDRGQFSRESYNHYYNKPMEEMPEIVRDNPPRKKTGSKQSRDANVR